MTFDTVQRKLKDRQRPGQSGEISLFAGLVKCGECGKALTIRSTNAKHPQRIYSCKTYNAFGKTHCTQHRIDFDTLYSLIREIIVHETVDEDKTRHISVEIHFNLKPMPEFEQVTA